MLSHRPSRCPRHLARWARRGWQGGRSGPAPRPRPRGAVLPLGTRRARPRSLPAAPRRGGAGRGGAAPRVSGPCAAGRGGHESLGAAAAGEAAVGPAAAPHGNKAGAARPHGESRVRAGEGAALELPGDPCAPGGAARRGGGTAGPTPPSLPLPSALGRGDSAVPPPAPASRGAGPARPCPRRDPCAPPPRRPPACGSLFPRAAGEYKAVERGGGPGAEPESR